MRSRSANTPHLSSHHEGVLRKNHGDKRLKHIPPAGQVSTKVPGPEHEGSVSPPQCQTPTWARPRHLLKKLLKTDKARAMRTCPLSLLELLRSVGRGAVEGCPQHEVTAHSQSHTAQAPGQRRRRGQRTERPLSRRLPARTHASLSAQMPQRLLGANAKTLCFLPENQNGFTRPDERLAEVRPQTTESG